MPDTIRVSASIRINSSPARVREQFRDIDHHIRNDVHPSIRFEWQASPAGERKIKSTFRILGVPQYDVAVLEDNADGSFVIRYLEGTNAGMLLLHRFVEIEPGVTEVQLLAEAPSTLARKILGPLFVIGARQVMKKALAEDKRDLEHGEYRPGAAAGQLENALASLAALEGASSAVKYAILEGACLVAACDGSIDAAERDALRRTALLLGASSDEADPGSLFDRALSAARGEEIKAELDRAGAVLRSGQAAREGVLAAVAIGLVSHGLSLGELEALRRLALAAGLDEATLGALVDVADAALSAS